MNSDIPEPWSSALVAARLTDPRYADDRPSLSRLAEVAGIHPTTVSRMVKGSHRANPANVALVAAALGRNVVEVSEWVRQARTVREPYQVPSEVNLLTDREQSAISELIRSIAANREVGTGDGDAAPITQSGGSPDCDVTVEADATSDAGLTPGQPSRRPGGAQGPGHAG